VIVSSAPTFLAENKGDLWASARLPPIK